MVDVLFSHWTKGVGTTCEAKVKVILLALEQVFEASEYPRPYVSEFGYLNSPLPSLQSECLYAPSFNIDRALFVEQFRSLISFIPNHHTTAGAAINPRAPARKRLPLIFVPSPSFKKQKEEQEQEQPQQPQQQRHNTPPHHGPLRRPQTSHSLLPHRSVRPITIPPTQRAPGLRHSMPHQRPLLSKNAIHGKRTHPIQIVNKGKMFHEEHIPKKTNPTGRFEKKFPKTIHTVDVSPLFEDQLIQPPTKHKVWTAIKSDNSQGAKTGKDSADLAVIGFEDRSGKVVLLLGKEDAQGFNKQFMRPLSNVMKGDEEIRSKLHNTSNMVSVPKTKTLPTSTDSLMVHPASVGTSSPSGSLISEHQEQNHNRQSRPVETKHRKSHQSHNQQNLLLGHNVPRVRVDLSHHKVKDKPNAGENASWIESRPTPTTSMVSSVLADISKPSNPDTQLRKIDSVTSMYSSNINGSMTAESIKEVVPTTPAGITDTERTLMRITNTQPSISRIRIESHRTETTAIDKIPTPRPRNSMRFRSKPAEKGQRTTTLSTLLPNSTTSIDSKPKTTTATPLFEVTYRPSTPIVNLPSGRRKILSFMPESLHPQGGKSFFNPPREQEFTAFTMPQLQQDLTRYNNDKKILSNGASIHAVMKPSVVIPQVGPQTSQIGRFKIRVSVLPGIQPLDSEIPFGAEVLPFH